MQQQLLLYLPSLIMSSYQPYPDSEIAFSPPTRPKFHYRNTNDRLREGTSNPAALRMIGKLRKDRRSLFKELGLDTDGHTTSTNGATHKEFAELTGIVPAGTEHTSGHDPDRSRGRDDSAPELQSPGGVNTQDLSSQSTTSADSRPWYSVLAAGRRPRIKTVASAPAPTMSTFTRLSSVALLIAVVLPGFSYYNGCEKVTFSGADAGVIKSNVKPVLEARTDSPVGVCKRWSQQGRPPIVMEP